MTGGIRHKAREALLWGGGFRVFRDLLQFAVMLALVRLLTPADYGRWGLLNSVLGFMGLVSAKTLFAHIVQVRDDEPLHLQDHFTAGTVLQCAFVVVVNIVALLLRLSSTYSPITPLLHVASLGLLLEPLADFWTRILERRLEFRRQRSLLAIGLLLSGSGALVMAAAGAGVWSLVVPPLLTGLPVAADLLLRERWRPDWTFSMERYRPALGFGVTRAASGSLNGVRDLLQSTLMVRLFGFATLGVYGRAIGLGDRLGSSIAAQAVSSLYPVLTRYPPGSPGFRRAAGMILRGTLWLVFPACGALALLAQPVVTLLYGHKWDAVVPLLPTAALETAVRATAATAYSMLLAAGHQRRCLQQDAMMLALALLALSIGLPRGPAVYLLLVAGAETAGLVLMLHWLLRDGALGRAELVLAAVPPSMATSAAALIGFLASHVTGGPGGWAPLAVTAAAFALSYVLALRLFFPKPLQEIVAFLPGARTIDRALLLSRLESPAS